MAKGKYGALISKISGSIGGTTFQNSNSGLIIKNKQIKNPTNTIACANTSAHFQYLSSLWFSLTEQQQLTWAAWIKFKSKNQYANNYKLLQPREAFIKFNIYNRIFGKTIILDPPFYYSKYNEIDIDIASTGFNVQIQTDRSINNNAEILLLWLTRPVNVTINNPGSRQRLIVCTNYNLINTDITTEYENVLGSHPIPGNWIIAKWQIFGYTELALSYHYYKKIQVSLFV